jgi:alcohol dehydrogenase (cytochrome c)
MEICAVIKVQKKPPESVPLNGLWFSGTFSPADPLMGKAYGHLDAGDPITEDRKWEIKTGMPMMGSLLTTASGLLFAGDLKGYAHAYDASSGQELRRFNLGSGTHGGPVTYAVGGKQYLLFPSGLSPAALGGFLNSGQKLQSTPAELHLSHFA